MKQIINGIGRIWILVIVLLLMILWENRYSYTEGSSGGFSYTYRINNFFGTINVCKIEGYKPVRFNCY